MFTVFGNLLSNTATAILSHETNYSTLVLSIMAWVCNFFTVCGSHSSVCAYITRLKREECCWDHGMSAVLPHVIVLTVEFKIHTPLLHINKTTLRITILSHTGSSSCTSVTSRGANGFFLFATNTAQHIHYNKCLA